MGFSWWGEIFFPFVIRSPSDVPGSGTDWKDRYQRWEALGPRGVTVVPQPGVSRAHPFPSKTFGEKSWVFHRPFTAMDGDNNSQMKHSYDLTIFKISIFGYLVQKDDTGSSKRIDQDLSPAHRPLWRTRGVLPSGPRV